MQASELKAKAAFQTWLDEELSQIKLNVPFISRLISGNQTARSHVDHNYVSNILKKQNKNNINRLEWQKQR